MDNEIIFIHSALPLVSCTDPPLVPKCPKQFKGNVKKVDYHREHHGASQSLLSSGGPLEPRSTWVGLLVLLGLDMGALSKPWAKEEVGRSNGNSSLTSRCRGRRGLRSKRPTQKIQKICRKSFWHFTAPLETRML